MKFIVLLSSLKPITKIGFIIFPHVRRTALLANRFLGADITKHAIFCGSTLIAAIFDGFNISVSICGCTYDSSRLEFRNQLCSSDTFPRTSISSTQIWSTTNDTSMSKLIKIHTIGNRKYFWRILRLFRTSFLTKFDKITIIVNIATAKMILSSDIYIIE